MGAFRLSPPRPGPCPRPRPGGALVPSRASPLPPRSPPFPLCVLAGGFDSALEPPPPGPDPRVGWCVGAARRPGPHPGSLAGGKNKSRGGGARIAAPGGGGPAGRGGRCGGCAAFDAWVGCGGWDDCGWGVCGGPTTTATPAPPAPTDPKSPAPRPPPPPRPRVRPTRPPPRPRPRLDRPKVSPRHDRLFPRRDRTSIVEEVPSGCSSFAGVRSSRRRRRRGSPSRRRRRSRPRPRRWTSRPWRSPRHTLPSPPEDRGPSTRRGYRPPRGRRRRRRRRRGALARLRRSRLFLFRRLGPRPGPFVSSRRSSRTRVRSRRHPLGVFRARSEALRAASRRIFRRLRRVLLRRRRREGRRPRVGTRRRARRRGGFR